MMSFKIPFYFGSAYFLLVSIVHAIGYKVPGLFIYYNVPSYGYQDRIISFLAFGWSVFFFQTAKSMEVAQMKSIVIIGFFALVMLVWINLTTDFSAFPAEIDVVPLHAEIALLAGYWLWLLLAYLRLKKKNRTEL